MGFFEKIFGGTKSQDFPLKDQRLARNDHREGASFEAGLAAILQEESKITGTSIAPETTGSVVMPEKKATPRRQPEKRAMHFVLPEGTLEQIITIEEKLPPELLTSFRSNLERLKTEKGVLELIKLYRDQI